MLITRRILKKKLLTKAIHSDIRGYVTLDKLKKRTLENEVDSIYVAFPDNYGRISTIKVNPDSFVNQYIEKGVNINSSFLHVDIEGNPIDRTGEIPNRVVLLKPDLSSMREMSWLKSKSVLVMGDLFNHDNTPVAISSRNILKRNIEMLKKEGMEVQGATELEYYFYSKKYSENFHKGLGKIKEVGTNNEDYLIQQGDKLEYAYEDFRCKLKEAGFPIESTKGEAGLGQHEINVAHAETLKMSDNAVALKLCLKQVSENHNATITFMAKPNTNKLGSSSHLHVSLHNASDGKNLFPGTDFKINDKLSCSNNMRYFIGGIMKYCLDTFIFFAPTINSYKRYKSFTWAPSNLDTWSVDNRTSPFRICGEGKGLRIEYRIPGGDCNQYLAYSALIASGYDGIKNKIEPPAITDGSSYDNASNGARKLTPKDLNTALKHFEQSEFINKYYGDEVHKHLINFYRNEINENEKNISKWELKRYFDLI